MVQKQIETSTMRAIALVQSECGKLYPLALVQ